MAAATALVEDCRLLPELTRDLGPAHASGGPMRAERVKRAGDVEVGQALSRFVTSCDGLQIFSS
jgi:hypothetical protein